MESLCTRCYLELSFKDKKAGRLKCDVCREIEQKEREAKELWERINRANRRAGM